MSRKWGSEEFRDRGGDRRDPWHDIACQRHPRKKVPQSVHPWLVSVWIRSNWIASTSRETAHSFFPRSHSSGSEFSGNSIWKKTVKSTPQRMNKLYGESKIAWLSQVGSSSMRFIEESGKLVDGKWASKNRVNNSMAWLESWLLSNDDFSWWNNATVNPKSSKINVLYGNNNNKCWWVRYLISVRERAEKWWKF